MKVGEMRNLNSSRCALTRQRGFTLVELAVVMVAIGLLLGAIAVGKDLQRSAAYQRLSSTFVQGWIDSYNVYVAGTGVVPGDTPVAPTGRVNAGTTELCGNNLVNSFLAAGISLPEGRAEGQQSRYVYLDSNGNPQEVELCLQNVNWAEPGVAVGTYVTRARNVMVLKNVTSALATLLDSQMDGHPDARFGQLREAALANAVATVTGQNWSIDERMAFGSTVPTSLDESQVATTTVLIKMSR
jgi:prepilin-type N-terminal cleavage/methylation domain-containing protein